MNSILKVVNALRFQDADVSGIEAISAREWPSTLQRLDEAHLTLALGVRCRQNLPPAIRERIDKNRASNWQRYERLMQAQAEVTGELSARGIEFVVLKGLTHSPYYCDDPRDRPQYDIDIYAASDRLHAATKAAQALGYQTVRDKVDTGADHLPVMIRNTGWKWRGDYFDPDMPPSLELHFRFWNARGMRFGVGDPKQFWRRRMDGKLNSADALTYSALHLARHLLTGGLRLRHVYEIAHFLDRSAGDDLFWSHWSETALTECRVLEGIAFRLAEAWFHCSLHRAARETVDELPDRVKHWFRLFGSSPALIAGRPNKNELWLHLCLIRNGKDRREIARRRIFPTRHSRVIPDSTALAQRSLHHLRTLVPTVRGAYTWWRGLRSDRTPPTETSPA